MRKFLAFAAFAIAGMAAPEAANAGLTINIGQSGTAVVASVSGTLNVNSLTNLGAIFGCSAGVSPAIGFIGTGPGATCTGFGTFSGPADFGPGPGSFVTASASSGDIFGFNAGSATLFVDPNFVSGSAITSGATFDNATLASLGLNAGQYLYTFTGDSVTVNIGQAAAVPEPATWAMMLIGFGAIGFALRRRGKIVAGLPRTT